MGAEHACISSSDRDAISSTITQSILTTLTFALLASSTIRVCLSLLSCAHVVLAFIVVFLVLDVAVLHEISPVLVNAHQYVSQSESVVA